MNATDYLNIGIFQVEPVEWTFENLGEDGDQGELIYLADYLARREFDLVINLPLRSGGARRVSSFLTRGYRTRRLAVDYSVPLLTDVKCAKLLVEVILNPTHSWINELFYGWNFGQIQCLWMLNVRRIGLLDKTMLLVSRQTVFFFSNTI